MELRYKETKAWQIKGGVVAEIEDPLTSERPLTIYFNDEELVTLLCTFEHVDELAVGYLSSEGFLKAKEDLYDVKVDEEKGSVMVNGKNAIVASQTFLKRYITTGCGKGTSFYQLSDAVTKPVNSEFRVKAQVLSELMVQSQRISELFKITGGVHSSAICSRQELLFFREDIGRHNTVDKLAGRCFIEGIDTEDKLLLTTGRLSSEIVIKAVRLGIPVIASRSAPTDLAVQYAQDLGICLVGFVRNQRMNVYTYPERIEA